MVILSVQSHVTYGHVGNSVATFLLQSMGHDVWPVHTVHFSNHPGYEDFRGSVVPAETLSDIFTGLDLNGWFGDCQAVLGGYMGSVENARATVAAVDNVKEKQAEAVFLCDPVIGDRPEGVYVSQDLVSFYRNDAVRQADILTPNLFELEVIVESPLTSIEAVCAAARSLISLGPKTIIVTSITDSKRPGHVGTLAVSVDHAWLVDVPRLDVDVKGAGDAFSALWLGHWLAGSPPDLALTQAVSGVYHLLIECKNKQARELPLVQSVQQAIMPALLYCARRI